MPEVPSIQIPDGVTEIGELAFTLCTSASAVHMPDTVETIGKEAFAYCHSLTALRFSDRLKAIPQKCCIDCKKLSSVCIPDSVQEVGEEAFYGCDSLSEVKIAEGSLQKIERLAFGFCNRLTTVSLPDSIHAKGIDDSAFMQAVDKMYQLVNVQWAHIDEIFSLDVSYSLFEGYRVHHAATHNVCPRCGKKLNVLQKKEIVVACRNCNCPLSKYYEAKEKLK